MRPGLWSIAGIGSCALMACGGRSTCEVRDTTFALHASTAFVTAGCEALPASFDIAASLIHQPDGSYVLSGTENGGAFTTRPEMGTSSDCYAMPTWYEPTVAHEYFLSFAGGPSRLDVVRIGQCMVRYSLR